MFTYKLYVKTTGKLYTVKAYTRHILKEYKNYFFFFLYPGDHFIHVIPLEILIMIIICLI